MNWAGETGQQRNHAVADNGQLWAEAERLKAEAAKAAEAHQAELIRLKDEREKAAAAKDGKLKAAVDKIAELEKVLEASGHAGDLERHGM